MENLSLPLSPYHFSAPPDASAQTTQMEAGKLHHFIGDAYRYIRRGCSGLKQDFYKNNLIDIINKYKIGCNKMYEDALKSRDLTLKLSQNIVRTIDLFKDMHITYANMEEYQHRICELLAIFIACELRLGVNSTSAEQLLIGNRIIFIMRKHLLQENKDETRCNILRTLVYIPRFFNAREIVCTIFKEFLFIKPAMQVNVFPDKLYMLYIIVFYRWMSMENNADAKEKIIDLAESFMKPAATLASSKLYAIHLPSYKTYSTATRYILNNLNCYKDIRNAAIIDNAFKKTGTIVNLCNDEDDDVFLDNATQNSDFAEFFSSLQLEHMDSGFTKNKFGERSIFANTVDLTVDENIDCETSIFKNHNKWLNLFHKTAKQLRYSQTVIEQQHNTEVQGEICLDSDSVGEEVEHKECVDGNTKCPRYSEELFVDSYPITTTPIHCGFDLETSDDEEVGDRTILSSRFWPGSTLRTYQIKEHKTTGTEDAIESPIFNKSTTDSGINLSYRQDSVYVTSTPLQRSGNVEYNGTDVQDENTDDMDPFLFSTLKHHSSNSFNTAKVIYSQKFPHLQQQLQINSDSSEKKTPKKSEQQNNSLNPNTSALKQAPINLPLETNISQPSVLQQTYITSISPDYFFSGESDRILCTSSKAGSTSTTASAYISTPPKQQEHIGQNINTNKLEIEQHTNINHNERLNFQKNLPVFNKNFLNSKDNLKIKLCKVNLNRKAISLHNCKSSSLFEKSQSHTLDTDNSSSKVFKQTETCQLQTITQNSNSYNKLDDNTIFKKLLSDKEIRYSQKCPDKPKVIFFNKKQSTGSQTESEIRKLLTDDINNLMFKYNQTTINKLENTISKKKSNSKNNIPTNEQNNSENIEIPQTIQEKRASTEVLKEKFKVPTNHTNPILTTVFTNPNKPLDFEISNKHKSITKTPENQTQDDQNCLILNKKKIQNAENFKKIKVLETDNNTKTLKIVTNDIIANDKNYVTLKDQSLLKLNEYFAVNDNSMSRAVENKHALSKEKTQTTPKLFGNFSAEFLAGLNNDNLTIRNITNSPRHDSELENKFTKTEDNICEKGKNMKKIKAAQEKPATTLTSCISVLSGINENNNRSNSVAKILNVNSQLRKPLNDYINKEFRKIDEEEDGEIVDNLVVISNDSNSTCSLPLKKRPTQADANDDKQNSQVTKLKQTPDIRKEVLIENSMDKVTLEKNTNIQCEEFISFEEFISKGGYEEFDDKPTTSKACLKHSLEPLSTIKGLVNSPVRPQGQPPIQIVAPQLKDNSPNHDHRSIESHASVAARFNTHPLPVSYPATPMLGVANIEILMDFNRFIEDLLSSPKVMTIIDNANACGYYDEGQTYEMERVAIMEHYNIANAKGNKPHITPLYWKNSDANTISIFNHIGNEWISLPPSTDRQLLKLSFVLSILQQQYNLKDIRQRIHLALTFLINNTNLQHFRTNHSNLNTTQNMLSAENFEIPINNDSLSSNLSMTSNTESVQNLQVHTQPQNPQYNWSPTLIRQELKSMPEVRNCNKNCQQQSKMFNTTITDQAEQRLVANLQNNSGEKSTNDQLSLYPACATTPQNAVIVNTNGMQQHDISQNLQDQQNILRTDDNTNSLGLSPSNAKRPCLSNKNNQNQVDATSPSNISRNVLAIFDRSEIDLQNRYRMKQPQQQHQHMPHNLPINIYKNINSTTSLSRSGNMPPLTQTNSNESSYKDILQSWDSLEFGPRNMPPPTQTNSNESSYKDILQPFITYLIKDHERTSKHLLQIVDEVSNNHSPQQIANAKSANATNKNLTTTQHPRNSQESHVPTIRYTPFIPLKENPQNLPIQNTGTIQMVQSFMDQTEKSYTKIPEKQIVLKNPTVTKEKQQFKKIPNPGFAKEYANFVGSRDKVIEKQQLRNYKIQNLQERPQQLHLTELPVLNSNKRKCQERNDKMAEVLKHKIAELSVLKHNVHIKLLEKEQKQAETIKTTMFIARRGRPKKSISCSACEPPPFKIKRTNGSTCQANKTDLLTETSQTRDHVYNGQRLAAREANRRIIICNKQFSV